MRTFSKSLQAISVLGVLSDILGLTRRKMRTLTGIRGVAQRRWSPFQACLQPVVELVPPVGGLGRDEAAGTMRAGQAVVGELLPAFVAFGDRRGNQLAGGTGRRDAMTAEGLRPPQAVAVAPDLRHLMARIAHQARPGVIDAHTL